MVRRLGHLLLLACLLAGTIPPAAVTAASARSVPAAHVPATTLLAPQSLTQTTQADFGPCDSPSTTTVVTTGGGAVQLAGTLADDFTEPELDAQRWLSGVWSTGSYTPSLRTAPSRSMPTAAPGCVRASPSSPPPWRAG